MSSSKSPLGSQLHVEPMCLTESNECGRAPVAGGERAHFVPLPPVQLKNGTELIADLAGAAPPGSLLSAPQLQDSEALSGEGRDSAGSAEMRKPAAISYHGQTQRGTQLDPRDPATLPPLSELAEDDDLPLQSMIRRALAQPKRGRPAAFDEHAKGKLVALLALGLSVRQSAGVLGVTHPTVLRALAADPALSEEVNSARFQAQLQPLGCVIREAQRSWRAATWLLKYLDGKLTGHEETPAEKLEREDREKHAANLLWEERNQASQARERARREAQKEEEQQKLKAKMRAEAEAMFPQRKRKPKPST